MGNDQLQALNPPRVEPGRWHRAQSPTLAPAVGPLRPLLTLPALLRHNRRSLAGGAHAIAKRKIASQSS